MEKKIDEMIDNFVDKKEIIIKQIDSIEDEVLYDILFSRYIEKRLLRKLHLIWSIHLDRHCDYMEKHYKRSKKIRLFILTRKHVIECHIYNLI